MHEIQIKQEYTESDSCYCTLSVVPIVYLLLKAWCKTELVSLSTPHRLAKWCCGRSMKNPTL